MKHNEQYTGIDSSISNLEDLIEDYKREVQDGYPAEGYLEKLRKRLNDLKAKQRQSSRNKNIDEILNG